MGFVSSAEGEGASFSMGDATSGTGLRMERIAGGVPLDETERVDIDSWRGGVGREGHSTGGVKGWKVIVEGRKSVSICRENIEE
jgi:hypothetical protein